MMQRRHVDLIDVGAFLAVHFDVDEEIVHHLCGWRVLEALVRHDVTPMAGGVADREQDWLVGALCLGKRLGSPWPPVDGVVLVLQQIGTGLAGETVFVGWSGGIGRHSMTMPGSVVGSAREPQQSSVDDRLRLHVTQFAAPALATNARAEYE